MFIFLNDLFLDMKNFYVQIKIQTPLTHMITANFQSYNNE